MRTKSATPGYARSSPPRLWSGLMCGGRSGKCQEVCAAGRIDSNCAGFVGRLLRIGIEDRVRQAVGRLVVHGDEDLPGRRCVSASPWPACVRVATRR